MTLRVLVIGGGITGLTVAHECREAGAEVTIVEKMSRWGGKVLSYRLSAEEGIAGAPVEHSLRVFGSSYFSLLDTMRRIPHGAGTCFDTLRAVPYLVLESPGKASFALSNAIDQPALSRLLRFYRAMRGFGVPRRDIVFWFIMIMRYLCGGKSGRARIAARSFDSLMAGRSAELASFLRSFADIITAVKGYASAGIFIDIFVRVMLARYTNVYRFSHTFNISNGPVNECLIDPWVAHLRGAGVRMLAASEVTELVWENSGNQMRRPVGGRLADGTTIDADVVVLAATPSALARLAPEFYARSGIAEMCVEASAGFQFFLSLVPPALEARRAFSFTMHSPWSIAWIIEAPPLWRGVSMPDGVAGVLSVTLSRLDEPGIVFGKPFLTCTADEAAREILAQIGFERNDLIVGFHVAPLLRRLPASEFHAGAEYVWRDWQAGPAGPDGEVWAVFAPLWMGSPKSGISGIPVATGIPGLFAAGEFTDTFMTLPTKEKSSQAGKMCAAAILAAAGMPYDRTRLVPPLRGPAAWFWAQP